MAKYFNIKISDETLKDNNIEFSSKWVYITLLALQKETGKNKVIITNEELAARVGISTKTLFKAKSELKEKGYIKITLEPFHIDHLGIKTIVHYSNYEILK